MLSLQDWRAELRQLLAAEQSHVSVYQSRRQGLDPGDLALKVFLSSNYLRGSIAKGLST